MIKVSVEVDVDLQYGRIVRVTTEEGTLIAIYPDFGTGAVIHPDGYGYGIKVQGDWREFKNDSQT